jgi:endonuclease YncB( thermonuclease family)
MNGSGIRVESMMAKKDRKYSTAYVGQAEAAKAARLGLWQGEFLMPWDWRKAHQVAMWVAENAHSETN